MEETDAMITVEMETTELAGQNEARGRATPQRKQEKTLGVRSTCPGENTCQGGREAQTITWLRPDADAAREMGRERKFSGARLMEILHRLSGYAVSDDKRRQTADHMQTENGSGQFPRSPGDNE